MSSYDQHDPGAGRPMRQLILLLFTAATSFILGVVIGRSSAPVQPIIKVTMPAAETPPVGTQNFNFYKELPKGETRSLGSGINHSSNLPASAPPPVTTKQAATTATDSPDKRDIKVTTPVQKIIKEERQSGWILQASSNPRELDAQSLSKRLRSKGYKTEVKPVSIKGKTWFRVYIGPYSTAAAAKEAAAKLSRQEGLAPIARRI